MTDLKLLKKQIDIQLDEYEQAIAAAVKWHEDWKRRQSLPGFKCKSPANSVSEPRT